MNADVPVRVFAEVAGPADEIDLHTLGDLTVHRVHRETEKQAELFAVEDSRPGLIRRRAGPPGPVPARASRTPGS